MSVVKVTIKQKPTREELEKRLNQRRLKLAAFKHVHREASIMLDRWVQKNFKSEGGNVGGWKTLKAGGRWKKNVGLDTSAIILQNIGRLRVSFLPFANKHTAGIGSELSYSKIHEKGIGVPQRRILPVAREVSKALKDLFDQHARVVARD